MREDLRKETSSEFADTLRQARADARELAREQEKLSSELRNENARANQSLSGSPAREDLLKRLAQQQQRLTNVVDQATQLSQQAEASEPLLSRGLYDTVRQFSQDSARNVREAQDSLLKRGMMTRDLYERLQKPGTPEGGKLLDIASEMLQRDFLPPAVDAAERSRSGMETLKQGIEKAAESVIGDDVEAMRFAEQELKTLADQLSREFSEGAGAATNQQRTLQPDLGTNDLSAARGSGPGTNQVPAGAAATDGNPGQGLSSSTESTPGAGREGPSGEPSPQEQGSQGGQTRDSESGRSNTSAGDRIARTPGAGQTSSAAGGGGEGGDISGSRSRALDRFLETAGGNQPLTGDGYANWSERLREVEDIVEIPELRNEVAAARERARRLRQELRQERKKPEWAVVRLQVVQPLVEVRNRLLEELARREAKEPMTPLDRDPVPSRYSDLVRRYYENLGRGQ
jgi:hypothetical protein